MQFNLIFGRFFLWVCPRCTPKRKGNYFPLVSIFSRFEMSCVWVCMYIIHIMESRHNDSALCIVVFALLSLAPSPLALLFTISQRIFTLFFFFFIFQMLQLQLLNCPSSYDSSWITSFSSHSLSLTFFRFFLFCRITWFVRNKKKIVKKNTALWTPSQF